MTPPSRTPTTDWDGRLGSLQGWLVLAAVAVMSLVNTAGAIPGTRWTPVFVPLAGVLVVSGAVIWGLQATWRARESGTSIWHELRTTVSGPAWVFLGAATALFSYALISAIVSDQFIWVSKKHVVTAVPTSIVVLPVVQSLLGLWAACLTIMVTREHRRFELVWRLSAALVPLSLLGWARVWWDDRMPRLWTQMGGAAVYPAVLILCLAIGVAGVLRRHRPKMSQWLVVCHLVLLILTGSRGGMLMLAALVVIAMVRLGREHTGVGVRLARMGKAVYLLGGAAVLAAAFLSPILHRIDERSAGRMMTWRVGWGAVNDSWHEIILGVGSGAIWPWFSYESGWQPEQWRSRVTGPFGYTLYHAHSLYLEVLAELGLVGVLLLALVLAPIAIQWIRGGSTTNMVLSSAAIACLAGFAFDTVLFKNFPVSFVWWLVAFGVLTTAHHPWVSPQRLVPAPEPARVGSDGGSGTSRQDLTL